MTPRPIHPNPDVEAYLAAMQAFVERDGDFPLLADLPEHVRGEASAAVDRLFGSYEPGDR